MNAPKEVIPIFNELGYIESKISLFEFFAQIQIFKYLFCKKGFFR